MIQSHLRVSLLLLLFCWSAAQAKVRSRSASAAQNSINDGGDETADGGSDSTPASVINTDFMDKLSWKCANNASCLYGLANSVLASYRRGETVKLGLFDLVKLPPTKNKMQLPAQSGRGLSTFVDFIGGNAIRIPVGPMVFSVQRAEDDANYIEIALLKKAANQARRGGDGGGLLGGGGDSGGGLLGGGGGGNGGGGLGGGGGHGILRHRKQQQDKKQFEMYIPMYLAATTFGWTMVAAKAVGLLTLKALIISKLALVVTAMVIIKKLMDNASDKMMYQYPEHSPYMMPYSMDYPMHAAMGGGSEISSGDMYPAAMHLAAVQQGHSGLESLGAESHVHHNFAEVQNNTQVLAALNAAGLGQKVKREDSWLAKTTAARRPLVYNYLQPHHPYYRTRK